MPSRPIGLLLPLLAVALCAASPLRAQSAVDQAARLLERKQFSEARQLLEPYAGSHPQDARAAYYMGRIHKGVDDADAAVEWLEKAVRLNGSRAEYYAALGSAYGDKATRASNGPPGEERV